MPRPEVFLSHASADKESVKAIALQLQQHGVPTWLDEWNIIPGEPWVDALGQALRECSGCVVFLGPSGIAPWHHEEVRTALDRAIRNRSFRVVPVLLPGTRRAQRSHLPEFLANRHWVEFSKELDDSDAIHRLVCGIRGVEPGGPSEVMRRFEPAARVEASSQRPMPRIRVGSTWATAALALLAGTLLLALFRPLSQKWLGESTMAPDAHVVLVDRPGPDSGTTDGGTSSPQDGGLSGAKDVGLSRPFQVEFTVQSIPLAKIEVFVNGRLLNSGQSPLTTRLSPAHVQLKVSGCPEPCSKSESVEVTAAPRQQSHTVRLMKGTVLIRSRPASHVSIDDGLHHDGTPCQFQLYEGEHHIHFECDRSTLMCADIQDVTRTVLVQPGKTVAVTPEWE